VCEIIRQPTRSTLVPDTMLCVTGCILCCYRSTVKYLICHCVDSLVPSSTWLYTLLVSLCFQVPGSTCILVPFPGCELDYKSTHGLFSTVAN